MTVSSPKIRRPSGTSAIPWRATASGGRPTRETSPRRIAPAAGRTSPMIAWSVEDFPAPFGPMRPTISPGATSSERPRTAATAP